MNGTGRPPGRPPRIQFPIRRTVVSLGRAREMLIEENTTVRCVLCGESFLVNGDTAFIRRRPTWEETIVRCPRCGKMADVFYYLRDPPPPPRIKNPPLTIIPWKTTEDW